MTSVVTDEASSPGAPLGSPLVEAQARRAARDVALGTATRPTWRGRTHLAAMIVAAPLLSMMIVSAPAGRQRMGVAIYAAGLCSMFLASTTYHRWVHTVRWRRIWRRADHAMIYVAIAGTSTPLCLAVLSPPAATLTLVVVWSAAGVGAVIKWCCWSRGDRLATAMYITNGWVGMALVPTLLASGLVLPSVLLVAGGVVYTVGAAGFARQWPTLRPTVFSYHEVWHLCTVAGAGAHLASVWIVTT